MKMYWTVKYRQPGQVFWRKVKRVVADGVEDQFRYFRQDDDTMIYVSNNAEVIFSPDRQAIADKNENTA